MYKGKPIKVKTKMQRNESVEGESIEMKMRRVLSNKEPITDGAPIIYQPRKDGVRPEYNIRTDRFEYAIDAMDKASKSKIAKRVNFHEMQEKKSGDETKGQSIQATE